MQYFVDLFFCIHPVGHKRVQFYCATKKTVLFVVKLRDFFVVCNFSVAAHFAHPINACWTVKIEIFGDGATVFLAAVICQKQRRLVPAIKESRKIASREKFHQSTLRLACALSDLRQGFRFASDICILFDIGPWKSLGFIKITSAKTLHRDEIRMWCYLWLPSSAKNKSMKFFLSANYNLCSEISFPRCLYETFMRWWRKNKTQIFMRNKYFLYWSILMSEIPLAVFLGFSLGNLKTFSWKLKIICWKNWKSYKKYCGKIKAFLY